MTSHVRLKSDLKDKIAYYQGKLPITERAVANITSLLKQTQDESLQVNCRACWRTGRSN